MSLVEMTFKNNRNLNRSIGQRWMIFQVRSHNYVWLLGESSNLKKVNFDFYDYLYSFWQFSPSLFRRKKCINRNMSRWVDKSLLFFSPSNIVTVLTTVDFFKTLNQVVQTTLKPSIHIWIFLLPFVTKG